MKTAIDIKNVISVAKKEFKTYFDNPTAYIAIVVFLLLWEFLFFRYVFLAGEASLRGLLYFLPWLFLLFIPAITMGSISLEKSEGTLEFLLTHPLKDTELIAGKFIAATGVVALTLCFIFPMAASLSAFGNLDWGVAFGQYLGSLLLASALAALGIFVSSRFASQISSLLVTAAASFLFVIAGLEVVTALFPPVLSSVFERLSVLSHFESMARGVIDLRDLWYFFSVVLIFLSLAYLGLIKRRLGNRQSLYRSYLIGVSLLIGVAVLINIVGARIPGRVDLTQGRLYTLTDATKKTLAELKDMVTVTLFASSELPAQLQPVLRDTKDILRDYRTVGKGNINILYKDPSRDPRIAQEAGSLGVRDVQFNVIGQEELRLKKGYLGLAVSYAGKNDAIPFIQDTSDLEYQLTSFVKNLSSTEKKKVAFLTGHGEKSPFRDYRALTRELGTQFEIEELTINNEKNAIPETIAVLVVAGPTQQIDETTKSAIRSYLGRGGSAVFLIDSFSIDPQRFIALFNRHNFAEFLNEYGIEVQRDLVYDLRSNETLSFGSGYLTYALPYPYWTRVMNVKPSPIVSRIESIVLPWASTIELDDETLKETGFTASKLFVTTQFGGRQQDDLFMSRIAPNAPLSRENLGEQKVAVTLVKELKEGNSAKTTRILVVGDSDFLSDQFAGGEVANIAFGMAALSWMVQEESLAGLRVKQKSDRTLHFENLMQMTIVKYGNLSLAFLMPAVFGLLRLARRRNLRKFRYTQAYE